MMLDAYQIQQSAAYGTCPLYHFLFLDMNHSSKATPSRLESGLALLPSSYWFPWLFHECIHVGSAVHASLIVDLSVCQSIWKETNGLLICLFLCHCLDLNITGVSISLFLSPAWSPPSPTIYSSPAFLMCHSESSFMIHACTHTAHSAHFSHILPSTIYWKAVASGYGLAPPLSHHSPVSVSDWTIVMHIGPCVCVCYRCRLNVSSPRPSVTFKLGFHLFLLWLHFIHSHCHWNFLCPLRICAFQWM